LCYFRFRPPFTDQEHQEFLFIQHVFMVRYHACLRLFLQFFSILNQNTLPERRQPWLDSETFIKKYNMAQMPGSPPVPRRWLEGPQLEFEILSHSKCRQIQDKGKTSKELVASLTRVTS
jgi:hypothetical protein